MEVEFYKYQGTGNDFIILDNRNKSFPENNQELVAKLCNRNFGIGADGLILLELKEGFDFSMKYYNSDGIPSSMCGNGGRCLVAFAKLMGLIKDTALFTAVDGPHKASIIEDLVKLEMKPVSQILKKRNIYFLDTGSPHHVQFVKGLENMDVRRQGKKLRYGLYGAIGANINFVSERDRDSFSVRTYERGVEDETLSCGTGVTATAIALYEDNQNIQIPVVLHTPGGILKVSFKKEQGVYKDVVLEGTATFVFKGIILV